MAMKAKKNKQPLVIKGAMSLDESGVDDTLETLFSAIGDGEFYYQEKLDPLVAILDDNDEDNAQVVYEVTFKRIGRILKPQRVFNEYV